MPRFSMWYLVSLVVLIYGLVTSRNQHDVIGSLLLAAITLLATMLGQMIAQLWEDDRKETEGPEPQSTD